MRDIYKLTDLKDSAHSWLPSLRSPGFAVYRLVIGLFLTCVPALFFIRVDISVRSNGIIRPMNERTEIHSTVNGMIDSIYFREGGLILKNNILLTLYDPVLAEKKHFNETEISRSRDFIHDLELLIGAGRNVDGVVHLLTCPLYKQEALKFISGETEQEILISKAGHETLLNEKLSKGKVISPKEMYDIRVQEQKMVSAMETFRHSQYTDWQSDLIKYKQELNQCISRQEELSRLLEQNRIRAPVSGYLQELTRHYAGGSVQSGELICTISPDDFLVGECYVSSKDIGMLRMGQSARFQIDAFNYSHFGMATGYIFSIANDFILMDKAPVFKVMCRLNESTLKLSNGYRGELKKGMGFRASFITAKRTLWQLLSDHLDDWLNPSLQPV